MGCCGGSRKRNSSAPSQQQRQRSQELKPKMNPVPIPIVPREPLESTGAPGGYNITTGVSTSNKPVEPGDSNLIARHPHGDEVLIRGKHEFSIPIKQKNE